MSFGCDKKGVCCHDNPVGHVHKWFCSKWRGLKKGLRFKPAKLIFNEPETAEHILIHCIAYKNKKHVLKDDLQKIEHNTL